MLGGSELVKEDQSVSNGVEDRVKILTAQSSVGWMWGDKMGKLVVPCDPSAPPQ